MIYLTQVHVYKNIIILSLVALLDNQYPFGRHHPQEFEEFNQFEEIPQEIIDPVREYEEHILNELCPNPDQMTYEQLINLGDNIGTVSKGIDKKLIKKLPIIKFNAKDKSNSIDK